ncbi:tyrosine-protein phosphatase [Labilibacter marinus]|uniref:tyrosine-protein phosphatase n=1 Tax=Labilibacter marinus TaxID=1477105 RepID=UPI000831FE7E|nr:tyrosine-protein phosphatase [Labilibacter marinus]
MYNEKAALDSVNSPSTYIEQPIIPNFRDASKYVSTIKPKMIFRTSSLTKYQDVSSALGVIRSNKIKTVIDLRAEREVNADSYSESFSHEFYCINFPLDPWNQPEWFVEETKTIYSNFSNAEKAYYFFIKCCQYQIRAVLETISVSEYPVAIHCVAGKDRTGLITILIGMLVGSGYEELLVDYLQSEQDTDEYKFRIFYDYIMGVGGIEEYLSHSGISKDVITTLKQKLGK